MPPNPNAQTPRSTIIEDAGLRHDNVPIERITSSQKILKERMADEVPRLPDGTPVYEGGHPA